MRESSPGQNYGNAHELFSLNEQDASRRPVLRFDLSSFAPGQPILRATAWLFATREDNSGDPITVHRITQDWTEGGVTWTGANDFDLEQILAV